MFGLKQIRTNSLQKILLFNDDSGESVTIYPEFGANVSQLTLKHNGKLIEILDGNSSRKEFCDKNIFKGAKLFPFTNRIPNGKFKFHEMEYHFPLNYPEENNACHGFIFNKNFELNEYGIEKDRVWMQLKYIYSGKESWYPFPFHFNIRYSLEKSGFICENTVINSGGHVMPIADGWHPFITLNSKLDNLKLKFQAHLIYETDERLIPSGDTKPYEKFGELEPIGKTEFDSSFLLQDSGKEVHEVVMHDPAKDLLVKLWQETGKNKYNYLHLYTPPHRNSIAVEPMTGIANAFNNEIGLIRLQTHEQFNAKYGIQLVQEGTLYRQ